MKPRRRALIVGGGIGGPVLGLWLRRIGLEATLLEARPAGGAPQGAFLGVAPNGMNVLHGLGLAERVAAVGHACMAFQFSNRRGRILGGIDRSQDRARFGWPLTMVRRSDLHDLLLAAARAAGVEVVHGARLLSLEQRGDEVVAYCGGAERRGSFAADLVVGCDGLRSTVRELLWPEAKPPTFSGLLDYGGFAEPDAAALPFARGVNAMVFGRRAFFGAFTTPSGHTWWFHNGPAAEPAGRRGLLELHREDPPWIQQLILATPELLGPWPLHDLPLLPRWSRGRVTLLGDAAHAMSPSAGQGAALAMEDAMVLARCLRDEPDPSAAFLRYEEQRRPRVMRIFKQAAQSSNKKAVANVVSEALRDWMLPTFLRMGEKRQSECYAERIVWD